MTLQRMLGRSVSGFLFTFPKTAYKASDSREAQLYDIGTPLLDNPLANWVIESISQVAFLASAGSEPRCLNFLPPDIHKPVGRHFFDDEGPVFALDQQGGVPCPQIHVNTLHEVDAPASLCSDRSVELNVKWLLLSDTRGTSHGGADTVYRVMTAGGSRPATCRGLDPYFGITYVAQCESTQQVARLHSYLLTDIQIGYLALPT